MIAYNLLALVGATLIVVRSVLFRPVRRIWPSLFLCSRCFGFWVGAAAGAAGLMQTGNGRVIDALLSGAATSCASILIDGVLIALLGDPIDDKEH